MKIEKDFLQSSIFNNQSSFPLWEVWRKQHEREWNIVQQHQREREQEEQRENDVEVEFEEGNEFDDIAADLRTTLIEPENYKIPQLLSQVEADMTLLVMLLSDVYQHLSPETDDKLQQLATALRSDPLMRDKKVIIFTEFRSTARYLWKQLRDKGGFTSLEELDSTRKVDREHVIKRFAPYYNCSEEELPNYLHNQIRILITTDVLSEGLNLQDATIIVNYDLHWNPVRLMQRIGRVDRRLNMEIEHRLGRDTQHPLKVHVYNFLPPSEMDDLLHLFQRVTGKLLRISKTLGIEAPILTPEDDYEALKLFNEKYEGQQSIEEQLHLELEQLRQEHPGLFAELPNFPKRIFSGKQVEGRGTRGLFCAYRFPPVNSVEPSPPAPLPKGEGGRADDGELRWYFRRADTGDIWESNRLDDIANAIRSLPQTQRMASASAEQLTTWRQEIERKCVRPYLRDLQAPIGEKATLVCWMEVC